MLEQSCGRFRERPAFTNMGVTLSYGELDRLSRDFGAYLQQVAGLRKGERVAIMLLNLLQYPVALFGALRTGLVVVNVNPLYTARELQHQLADSGAAAVVVLENFAHTLQEVVATTAVRHVIFNTIQEPLQEQLAAGKKIKIREFFNRITRDERLFAVGYCASPTATALTSRPRRRARRAHPVAIHRRRARVAGGVDRQPLRRRSALPPRIWR